MMARKHKKHKPVNVRDLIISSLSTGPLPSSLLYSRLKSMGVPGNQARTAVSRMVRSRVLRQYKLILGSGNRILTLSEPKPDAALLRLLYDNDFFGRPSLKSLVDCLVSSHQIVTSLDVAKIAVLKVGAAPGNLSETIA